jgi:hypothetical protein
VLYQDGIMKKVISILNILLIIFAITSYGCDYAKRESEKKGERNDLAFIVSSKGLPSKGQWREALTFCDINGDGHLDILAPPVRTPAKSSPDSVPVVWYGNGKGEWSRGILHVPADIAYGYGGITSGDFDGDGIPDIALGIHGLGLKVLKGQGQEKYVDFSNGLPSKEDFVSRALISADFNNDGTLDLAAVSEAQFGRINPMPSGVWVCYRSQDGWRCSPVADKIEVRNLFADQITAGDVNGDGNTDIAVASLVSYKNLIIWLNDGKGNFTSFNKGLPKKKIFNSVALADVNQDGRDDLIASISGFGPKGFNGIKAFLSGPEAFEELSEGLPSDETFFCVNACDFDNDGRFEIVGGTRKEGIKIFSLKGSRWHKLKVSGLPEEGLEKMKNIYCVDLNGDGYKDIAVNYSSGENKSGGIRVFLNVPRKD